MREQGYDLREYAQRHWATIGPKLAGKLHFFAGDMDDFYLNLAVYRFEDLLKSVKNPRSDAKFTYGRPMKGHSWHEFHWVRDDAPHGRARTEERATWRGHDSVGSLRAHFHTSTRGHIMQHRLRRELRLLRAHALITTPLLIVLLLAGFLQAAQRTRFTEIDVERINIVEPDGKLRMVISNRPRSIGPIYKGKLFGYPGGTRPGIIFFNDEGTENGGLGFGGGREPDGTFRAGAQLAFDQYDQDQVLFLQYSDNNGQRRMGLTVADRADVSIYDFVMRRDSINKMPDGPAKTAALAKLVEPVNGVPLAATRVYVGRDASKAAIVNLSDRLGRARLRLLVDSTGAARIEFLDEAGRVVKRIPGA